MIAGEVGDCHSVGAAAGSGAACMCMRADPVSKKYCMVLEMVR